MDLSSIMDEWSAGNDLEGIRGRHSSFLFNRILDGDSYPILYRYIDSKELQVRGKDKIDPLYRRDVGDTITYGLISTTTSNPQRAYDTWFDYNTTVIIFKDAKGIDVNALGGQRFSWEKEILSCGLFRIEDIKEKSFRKIGPYLQYTLKYIDDEERQIKALQNLLKNMH